MKELNLKKRFNEECDKSKYRSISPNWEFVKIEDEIFECKNKKGGNIVFKSFGSENILFKKIIVIIKNRNGITKKKISKDILKQLEFFVNYMRRNPCN